MTSRNDAKDDTTFFNNSIIRGEQSLLSVYALKKIYFSIGSYLDIFI